MMACVAGLVFEPVLKALGIRWAIQEYGPDAVPNIFAEASEELFRGV